MIGIKLGDRDRELTNMRDEVKKQFDLLKQLSTSCTRTRGSLTRLTSRTCSRRILTHQALLDDNLNEIVMRRIFRRSARPGPTCSRR